MTREQAKKILLMEADKEIKKHGEYTTAVMSPKIGKDHWTWKEYREAVENDKPLEGTDMNPIDNLLRYEEYRILNGMESMVDKFLKEEEL